MPVTLAPVSQQQFFDAGGNPLAGGLVYTYQAGTSTPLASYTDAGGATANANPVVLDAAGRADIWLSTAQPYKVEVRTSAGVVVYTTDNVNVGIAAGMVDAAAIIDGSVTDAKITDNTAALSAITDKLVFSPSAAGAAPVTLAAQLDHLYFPDDKAFQLPSGYSPPSFGHSIQRPACSSAPRNIYVNPTTGSDTAAGTNGAPFKTFARAVKEIPYNLFHEYNIYLADGTYNETLGIIGLGGSPMRYGTLQIIGNTTTPANVIFEQVDGLGNRLGHIWNDVRLGYNAVIKGVTFNGAVQAGEVFLRLEDCIIRYGSGTYNLGLGGHGGRAWLLRVDFKDIDNTCVEAVDFAQFYLNSCTVTNFTGTAARRLVATNGSMVTIASSPDFESSTNQTVESGSSVGGSNQIGYYPTRAVQGNRAAAMLLSGGPTSGLSGNNGASVYLGGDQDPSSPRSAQVWIGSQANPGISNFDVINANTGGTYAFPFRVKCLSNGTSYISFHGATEQAKPTISGSRGGNAALASLLTALAAYGLITDSTTA